MKSEDYSYTLYEKALMPHDWPRMLSDAAELGFNGFEVSVDESDYRLERLDWSESKCLEVVRLSHDAGIRLQSLCFSGQRRFPMGSSDPKIVIKSMTMMRKCIDLCFNLGIRVLQVAGFDVFYEENTAETYKRYCDNLVVATKYAESAGVMLAIEPVEKGVLSVSMALDIINRINSPFLQIYPDIANMASLGIDFYPEIEKGVGHIAQIHIRDALPDFYYGVDIGTGIIDFVRTFRLFDRLDITCPLTLEMWNLDNPEYMNSVRYALNYLKEMSREARKY